MGAPAPGPKCGACGHPLTCEAFVRQIFAHPQVYKSTTREAITTYCRRAGYALPTIRRALGGLISEGVLTSSRRSEDTIAVAK